MVYWRRESSILVIIAHRAQECESPIDGRFGVELDVRDDSGDIVVCHDPFYAYEKTLTNWILDDVRRYGCRPVYALNIKADGLEDEIEEMFSSVSFIRESAFVFNMSYPSMKQYQAKGIPFAERLSEEETYWGRSPIVWMDRWDWSDAIPCGRYVAFDHGRPAITIPPTDRKGAKCRVYAVSPELHNPDANPSWVEHFWQKCVEWEIDGICTDWTERCNEVVNG